MNRKLSLLALGAVLLAGCGGGQGSAGTQAADTSAGADDPRLQAPSLEQLGVANLPGMPASVVPDPVKAFTAEQAVVLARYGGARKDPFALKPTEAAFEVEQNSARLLGTMGSWTMMYTPPPEKAPDAGLIHDTPPYRRLSGVVVGDSVYAILEENGKTEIIRPGSKIPGTEWEVVSIDTEKAILRRKGNKVPREQTVRLEVPPPGMGGAPTNPFGGAGGGRPGAAGGMPGGGVPGGKPGGAGMGAAG